MEDESESDVNISRLSEMAKRGDDYREVIEFSYYGLEGDLYVRPLTDLEFLPIAKFLEDRLNIDPEEAQERLEEGRDEETGTIDPEQFDKEFVKIMHRAAIKGIGREQGIAEGADEEEIRETVGMLQGGKSLVISERVLEISSDANKAEKFRRDGGSK